MKHAALLSATEAAEMILRVGAGFSCIWCSIADRSCLWVLG